MTNIPVIDSAEHPCNYQHEKQARLLYVHPELPPINNLYTHLITMGFRRSGKQLYRPHCNSCQDCISLRVPVNSFKSSKSQKRIINKNTQTTTRLIPAAFNEQHFKIYVRYQNNRHPDGEMSQLSKDDYLNFLTGPWCNTLFMEIRIKRTLVGIAVIDQIDSALSAVYTFYDPDFQHFSLGHFAILKMIHYASLKNLTWVYLGYWIEPCKNMAYKANYRPIEAFINGQWQLYKKGEAISR